MAAVSCMDFEPAWNSANFQLDEETVEYELTPSTCDTAFENSGTRTRQHLGSLLEADDDENEIDRLDRLGIKRGLSMPLEDIAGSQDECFGFNACKTDRNSDAADSEFDSGEEAGLPRPVRSRRPGIYQLELAAVEDEAMEAFDSDDMQDMPTVALLVQAATAGQTRRLGFLAGRGGDKDAEDQQGVTPLQAACCFGKIESVNCLCQLKADVHKANGAGMTPLYLAAEIGHSEIVCRLCIANARLDTPDKDGNSPLHVACSHGHVEVVRLLSHACADVQTANKLGVTPLLAASYHGGVGMVQFICEQAANHDVPDIEGWTPLYAAAFCGHVGIVHYLLAVAANAEHEATDGSTALNAAFRQGHQSVVEVLQKALDSPHLTSSIASQRVGDSICPKRRGLRRLDTDCSAVSSATMQLPAGDHDDAREERFQEALDQINELESLVRKLQRENADLARDNSDLQEHLHMNSADESRVPSGRLSILSPTVHDAAVQTSDEIRRDTEEQDSQAFARPAHVQNRFKPGMVHVMSALSRKAKGDAKAQIAQATFEKMELREELKLVKWECECQQRQGEEWREEVSLLRLQSCRLEQEVEEKQQRDVPLSVQLGIEGDGATCGTLAFSSEVRLQVEELQDECERLRRQLILDREAEGKSRAQSGRAIAELREEQKAWGQEAQISECRAERKAEVRAEHSAEAAVAHAEEEMRQQLQIAVEGELRSQRCAEERLRRIKSLQRECTDLRVEMKDAQGETQEAGMELQRFQEEIAHLQNELACAAVNPEVQASSAHLALESECWRQHVEVRAMARTAARARMSHHEVQQLVQCNEDLQESCEQLRMQTRRRVRIADAIEIASCQGSPV